MNRGDFAIRLSERINRDPNAQRLLRPRAWDSEARRVLAVPMTQEQVDSNLVRLNDVVAEMISVFWRSLTVEDDWDSWLDRRFLDCWEELWHRAAQNLDIRELRTAMASGSAVRRPQNFRMVDPEKARSRKQKRIINRYLREHPNGAVDDQPLVTPDQQAEFEAWLAVRQTIRASVANQS